MTTETVSLASFLLARIAEDEYYARGVEQSLRLCKAHRAIVELHSTSFCAPLCDTIRALASIYADDPAFREEWRV